MSKAAESQGKWGLRIIDIWRDGNHRKNVYEWMGIQPYWNKLKIKKEKQDKSEYSALWNSVSLLTPLYFNIYFIPYFISCLYWIIWLQFLISFNYLAILLSYEYHPRKKTLYLDHYNYHLFISIFKQLSPAEGNNRFT